jgi:hypothetical protein
METADDARCTVDEDGAATTLLAEFRTWLGRERGLSPVSVRCYCQQAKAFLTGLGGPEAVGKLDAGQVVVFMVDHTRCGRDGRRRLRRGGEQDVSGLVEDNRGDLGAAAVCPDREFMARVPVVPGRRLGRAR